MGGSGREIEIKLAFPSAGEARRGLERLGARVETPRIFEDNVLFDRESGELAASGVALRLRRVGARAILTLKAPVAGEHRHKVREEHETSVEHPDATTSILGRLGLAPTYRYQKYRTTYVLPDEAGLAICLDETPLGCFVELEGPPEAIDRTARRLGAGEADYVRESYVELHTRRCGRTDRPDRDLVFDADAGGAT